MSRPPIICLMGPTASGKTDLALSLCDALPCDIISVDSAMIYRGMDIGTAKPSPEELRRAPHRLIDICEPTETYSAADFRQDALREIESIHVSGRIPLLVGGTMMYFKALKSGISGLPSADPALREAIEQQAKELGWESLHQELMRVDPFAAERIHPNNRQRLMRAIEVIRLTGQPISNFWRADLSQKHEQGAFYTNWQADESAGLPYTVIELAITTSERRELHQRIEQRFRAMLAAGFLEEVRSLRARGDLNPELPSMRCVGYRQAWEYLEGSTTEEEFVQRGIAATRQLAKRQLTWLRKWQNLNWLTSGQPDLVFCALNLIESGITLETRL